MQFSPSFISFFSASDTLSGNVLNMRVFLRARDQDSQRHDTTDKSLTYTSYLVISSQASCLRHPVLYRSCIPSYLYANAYQFYVAVYASMHFGVIGPDTQNFWNGNPSCVQSRSDITHHSFRGPSCDKSMGLFQREFSTECDLVLSLSISSIHSFTYDHPAAVYVFSFLFLSLANNMHLWNYKVNTHISNLTGFEFLRAPLFFNIGLKNNPRH